MLSPLFVDVPLGSCGVYCSWICCSTYPRNKQHFHTLTQTLPSVKLGEAGGVDLESTCEAYATTLLGLLHVALHFNSMRVTVLQMSRCVCAVEPTSGANNWKILRILTVSIHIEEGLYTRNVCVFETTLTLCDVYCFEYQFNHFQPSIMHHLTVPSHEPARVGQVMHE